MIERGAFLFNLFGNLWTNILRKCGHLMTVYVNWFQFITESYIDSTQVEFIICTGEYSIAHSEESDIDSDTNKLLNNTTLQLLRIVLIY